eukprot:11514864-Alexandrium_andersonii.AAC.1
MSASLVGSEMCIRDRLRSRRPQEGRTGLASRCRVAHRADNGPLGDTRRPVSYTHLTLPTICSV